jgi:hypothetical protein
MPVPTASSALSPPLLPPVETTSAASGDKEVTSQLYRSLGREQLREAKSKLLQLIAAGDKWAHFCLARLYAGIPEKEEKARRWLVLCNDGPSAPLARATRWQMSYFDRVRHQSWFRALVPPSRLAYLDT